MKNSRLPRCTIRRRPKCSVRARFPFHPIGVSHGSTPFDTRRHANFCRTRFLGVRGLPGHAVELSDILTYGYPSTIVPSTHPRCIGAAGKVITKTPFRSYGSSTLLRVPLVPCVGPASSTALMAVTRTVLTIPRPYTHRRWSEVSFTRSQGPHDPESTMIR